MIKIIYLYSKKNTLLERQILSLNKEKFTIMFDSIKNYQQTVEADLYLLASNDFKIHQKFFANAKQIVLYEENPQQLANLLNLMGKYQISNAFSLNDLANLAEILEEAFTKSQKQIVKLNKQAKIISVASFTSGTGKSIISYNLAKLLCKNYGENAVIVNDFSQPFGSLKGLLNIEAKFSWQTIKALLTDKKIIEMKKLADLIVETPYDFVVLPEPQNLEQDELNASELDILEKSEANNYQIVINDFPAFYHEQELLKLKNSDLILIIMTLDANSIYSTQQFIKSLKAQKLFDKTVFIINKINHDEDKYLIRLIEEKLYLNIFATLEDDYQACRFVNEKFSLFDDPELLITHDFQKLAQKIQTKLI